MKRIGIILAGWLSLILSFSSAAQSKKELAAQLSMYDQKAQKWGQDSMRMAMEISQLSHSNAALLQQLNTCTAVQAHQKTSYQQLEQKALRSVEVYDLYSFGYQPLRNSDKAFEEQARVVQRGIEQARWKNVEELLFALQSPKRSEADKQLLWQAFIGLYAPLADISQADFVRFDMPIQTRIRAHIAQQTQTELRGILRENLWIQAIDSRWEQMTMLLLQKYK